MPADLSWLDGTVDDAAAMLADRAVASRALGGVVKAGERPEWADDLMKAAALVKRADPLAAPAPAPAPATGTGDFIDRNLGDVKKWVGGQATGALKDSFTKSPQVQNSITGGLVGAGVGALGGLGASMFSKNKRKRPVSNALFGGMLGGLGGAAIGGLGGAGGLFGKQDKPKGPQAGDPTLIDLDHKLNRGGEWNLEKTWDGLNSMSNAEMGKGFGVGAGAWAGAETGLRAVGRYMPYGFGNYTRTGLAVSPLQAAMSPSAAATARTWTAGAKPPTTEMDAVRRALQGSKDPVAQALGKVKQDASVVKALTGGGYSMTTPAVGRTALMTPGSLLRSGKAGLLGTLISGGQKGVDDHQRTVVPGQIKDMAIGLQARYGPSDAGLKTELDEIIGRVGNSAQTPLTDAKTQEYIARLSQIRQALATQDAAKLEAQRAAAGYPTGK